MYCASIDTNSKGAQAKLLAADWQMPSSSKVCTLLFSSDNHTLDLAGHFIFSNSSALQVGKCSWAGTLENECRPVYANRPFFIHLVMGNELE